MNRSLAGLLGLALIATPVSAQGRRRVPTHDRGPMNFEMKFGDLKTQGTLEIKDDGSMSFDAGGGDGTMKLRIEPDQGLRFDARNGGASFGFAVDENGWMLLRAEDGESRANFQVDPEKGIQALAGDGENKAGLRIDPDKGAMLTAGGADGEAQLHLGDDGRMVMTAEPGRDGKVRVDFSFIGRLLDSLVSILESVFDS